MVYAVWSGATAPGVPERSGAYVWQVSFPSSFTAEGEWLTDIVFGRRWGLPAVSVAGPDDVVEIRRGERRLTMPAVFVKLVSESGWLSSSSVPRDISGWWTRERWWPSELGAEVAIPCILGNPGLVCSPDGSSAELQVDVMGVLFLLMSGYLDAVSEARDHHGRVPASGSLLGRHGLLDRPVADEHIELLWGALKLLWPSLTRRPREGVSVVTCDVDRPFTEIASGVGSIARGVAHHLVRQRNPRAAVQAATHGVASRFGVTAFDPNDTFDWIMRQSEKAGRSVCFHVFGGRTSKRYDASYDVLEPRTQELLARIIGRGHGVGLHGSYESWRQPEVLRQERQRVEKSLRLLGDTRPILENRQHYLRWDPVRTPAALAAAGLTVDSSVGFADRAGFRAGTAHEFPHFDLGVRRPLGMVERPLVVMEDSLFASEYMALGHRAAWTAITTLKERSLRYGGRFTLLWHNDNLRTAKDRELFVETIS